MIRVERPVAFIELERAGTRGLLDAAIIDELERDLDTCDRDDGVRGVVLAPASETSFCEGFDARALLSLETRGEADELFVRAHRLVERIRTSEKPFVAAVRGRASGAGFELALACRARVAADEAATRFALPEVRLGLAPWMQGLERLTELCGLALALEMAVDGRELDASGAHASGLVDVVAKPDELLDRAATLALGINRTTTVIEKKRSGTVARVVSRLVRTNAHAHVRKLGASNHPAGVHTVAIAERAARGDLASALEVERRAFGELVTSSATRTLLSLEQAEEAQAQRLDELRASARRPETIAVVGTTSHAIRLAKAASAAGIDVRAVTEVNADTLRCADVVVEASRGTLDEKREALARVEQAARPHATIAVASDDHVLAEIAAHADERRIVGIATCGRLVELVPLAADLGAVAQASFLVPTHAVALIEGDGVGRFSWRMSAVYVAETLHLLDDGASVGEIADAAHDWGFSREPLSVFVEMGPRATSRRIIEMAERIGERLSPSRTMVAISTGACPPFPAPSRSNVLRRGRIAPEQIQMRLALAIVNEAHHCLEEGIVASPRDGDVAAVAAGAFPAFRGGPFHYAEHLGAELLERLFVHQKKHGTRFEPAALLRR
ncbi:MAG: hypothetical protein HOW73_20915 [Polyangiaceae bacterium]|nr:hypothetical protein [Polyangiaceae bacterium]